MIPISSALIGFLIGFFIGVWFGCIALSIILTARREDEREAKLFEEYMKQKEREDEH